MLRNSLVSIEGVLYEFRGMRLVKAAEVKQCGRGWTGTKPPGCERAEKKVKVKAKKSEKKPLKPKPLAVYGGEQAGKNSGAVPESAERLDSSIVELKPKQEAQSAEDRYASSEPSDEDVVNFAREYLERERKSAHYKGTVEAILSLKDTNPGQTTTAQYAKMRRQAEKEANTLSDDQIVKKYGGNANTNYKRTWEYSLKSDKERLASAQAERERVVQSSRISEASKAARLKKIDKEIAAATDGIQFFTAKLSGMDDGSGKVKATLSSSREFALGSLGKKDKYSDLFAVASHIGALDMTGYYFKQAARKHSRSPEKQRQFLDDRSKDYIKSHLRDLYNGNVEGNESQDKKILGVQGEVTRDSLKAAYRKVSAKAHPDRGGSKEAFQRVQRAYENLRQKYNLAKCLISIEGIDYGWAETNKGLCLVKAAKQAIQVGATKTQNGKTYVFNENRRWTLKRDEGAAPKKQRSVKPKEPAKPTPETEPVASAKEKKPLKPKSEARPSLTTIEGGGKSKGKGKAKLKQIEGGKQKPVEQMSLKEMFAEGDRVGSKYQTEPKTLEERREARQGAQQFMDETGGTEAISRATGKVRKLAPKNKAKNPDDGQMLKVYKGSVAAQSSNVNPDMAKVFEAGGQLWDPALVVGGGQPEAIGDKSNQIIASLNSVANENARAWTIQVPGNKADIKSARSLQVEDNEPFITQRGETDSFSDIGQYLKFYADEISANPGGHRGTGRQLAQAAKDLKAADRNWVPVLVREKGPKDYEVVGNHFAFEASKQAGLERIWVVVVGKNTEKSRPSSEAANEPKKTLKPKAKSEGKVRKLTPKNSTKPAPSQLGTVTPLKPKPASPPPPNRPKPKVTPRKGERKSLQPKARTPIEHIETSPEIQAAAAQSPKVASAITQIKKNPSILEKVQAAAIKNPGAVEDIAVAAIAMAGQFALMPQADLATAALMQGAIGVATRAGARAGKRIREELKTDPNTLKSLQGAIKLGKGILSDLMSQETQEKMIGDAIAPAMAAGTGAAVGGGLAGTLAGTGAAVGAAPKAAGAIRQTIANKLQPKRKSLALKHG